MALKFEYDKEKRTAVVCGVEDKFCEQIVIPSTVEYYRKKYDVVAIKYDAFKECIKLTSVTIPDSVTEIGGCAFEGCSSLKEFKGKYAADNGRCLIKDDALIAYASASGTTYAILDSVTKIEMTAFSGCSSLTSVTIPDSVTEIGGRAFHGCSNLKEFKGKFAADNGRCLIKDDALIAYASASGTTYAIPNGVTKIGYSAFSGFSSLTSVTIPNSVTVIESSAFKDCSRLTNVTIPNSVTKIGDFAFQWCSKLENVDICNEEGCVKILPLAFRSATKVTYLGKDAQPKPKQEVKEQPAPKVAKPAPTIDLDKLIDAAAADGVITDKERSVVLKKAVAMGYDADEVEILIDGKIAEKQREAQPKKKGLFARLFGKK